MNTLARVISVVFHPLLLTTYLFGLLSFVFPSALYPFTTTSRWWLISFIFVLTFLLPAINIFFLRALNTISSWTMEDRRERIRPFFLITIIYCLVTYVFSVKTRISTADSMFKLFLIIDCLVIAATVITFVYKISIHSLGISGIVGILISFNWIAEDNTLFIPTLMMIVLAGIVMSSRLQLNAHTTREVWVGGITGLAIGLSGMFLLF
ncbi:MAG: hypothetical protein WAZ98_03700 [Cyclobacteriaceae bacterium]